MIFFAALGDQKASDAELLSRISVGVGTLAGSTIMLLTIPWWVTVLCGRVELDEEDGKALYQSSGLKTLKSDSILPGRRQRSRNFFL